MKKSYRLKISHLVDDENAAVDCYNFPRSIE